MGYRLTKIYTRKGDKGKTRLGDGTKVDKDHLRVESYGNVDELNSFIGLLLTMGVSRESEQCLTEIQHDLFDLGGELSVPGHEMLRPERVGYLETVLDCLNAELEPLEEFILPGGTGPASVCHVARTVCRRAERSLVTLSRSEKVSETALSYLNRLSDLFFVMARSLNKEAGKTDVLWKRNET